MGSSTEKNGEDDMNISDDEMEATVVIEKKPLKTGEYHWKKLVFSTCDGQYCWYHYEEIHNFFAQEHTIGKWYVRNIETSEFQEFDWEKNAAPEEPEQNKALITQRLLEKDETVLYVKMSAEISPELDSYQRPIYKFNSDGQPLTPRNEEFEPVFPCDEKKVPLFPFNLVSQQHDFLYNEDGIQVVPLNDEEKVIVPLDQYGQPIFPLDSSGNLIWPIDDEGLPYPPLNPQGIPSIRYDENGLPIVPHDASGEQMIFFDKEGIPIKMSEFREKFTKEETLKWGGGYLPPQLALPPPPIPDPIVNPYDFTDPATVMTEAPPNIDANIPVLQLPEIPPEYAQAMAIHARGLSGKFKMEYELEWKYFGDELAKRQAEAIRIYNEEVEKYIKAQKADEERKKRLGNFLKKTSGKAPVPAETKEVKKMANQLQVEIQAKRERLREEEEKKKNAQLKEVEKYVEPLTAKEEDDNRTRRYSPDRSPRNHYKPYFKREYGADRYRKWDDRGDVDSWKFNPKHRADKRREETSQDFRRRDQSRSRSVERKKKYSDDSEEERHRKKKQKKREVSSSDSEKSSSEEERRRKKKKSKKHKKEKRRKHQKKESTSDTGSTFDEFEPKRRRRRSVLSGDESPRAKPGPSLPSQQTSTSQEKRTSPLYPSD